ncbi:MAG: hypothetical protein RML15_02770 [Bacteroidota bacterium]|nr:hypothetical protein [Candidatus Kapabacteria bacterium]MCS7302564.1 hypothetical protein [Candidatus Kapabacteria bacterium]MCX7936750.1 hypothetical protein [Chlorobiota bacterium]MDW8074206.1 hypothetical protein [Bacteroidota bacterium]MDW8271318.1 hypothetical protein [Bacteroidota bacterium]
MTESTRILIGIVAGFVLSAANIGAGLLVARRAQQLPVNKATTLVLSAMAVRLIVMVVLIGTLVSTVELNKVAFALTLMFSFFAMVVLEAFFLHAQHEKAKVPLVRRHHYRRPRVPFTVW